MSAKMSGPFKGALALVIVVTAVGFWLWLSLGRSAEGPADAETASGPSAIRSVAAEKGSAAATDAGKEQPAKAKKRPRVNTDYLAGLSSVDRRRCEALEAAQSGGRFKEVRDAALEAYRSNEPGVRELAVEALEWFGEKALPELTTMMGDKDEDVAQTAMSAWQTGLSEITDSSERALTAQLALKTISDPVALEMIGAEFANAATEMIDDAEDDRQAGECRTQVVQAIVDMMGDESSQSRTAAAKEVYEAVTGHEWVSVEEAERYLGNPDDYESPEED